MDPLAAVSTRATVQTAPARPGQVANHQGGYVFAANEDARLRRFLILGVDGGTYYQSAAELTRENADVVMTAARERPLDLVDLIVDVSTRGAAPRVQPALFALAAAASLGNDAGRAYALAKLPVVARTGTHLFTFAGYVEQFRGWGRGLRRAIGHWYADKTVEALVYQLAKYRQRAGWSHRDLLRLSHPRTVDPARAEAYAWAVGKRVEDRFGNHDETALLRGFEIAQRTTDPAALAGIVRDYGLTWEMLPSDALNAPAVWEALLEGRLPLGALIRQLPRLTKLGLLPAMGGGWTGSIVERLTNPVELRAARIHPMNLLVAQRTYAQGHGERGHLEWTPSTAIVDALDRGFYAAFETVKPTGKRTMLALDCSASMTWGNCAGLPITPREASAALSLVTAAAEPAHMTVGFSASGFGNRRGWGGIEALAISPRQRLNDAIRTIESVPAGGTDCALPMMMAAREGIAVDHFTIFTDNETAHGLMHPFQALRAYRETTGIAAKLSVVAMTSTGFTIADPSDPGMLDIVGMDINVPALLSEFAAGAL